MRCYKQSFSSLTQFRVEKLVSEGTFKICEDLLICFSDLLEKPSHTTLMQLTNLKEFDVLCKQILHVGTGTEVQLTVEFLKDVYFTLSLIVSVRDFCFDLHLQAQCDALQLIFALVHYSRYMSYERVFLRCLEQIHPLAYNELVNKGTTGASISGNNFSSIHGDLVTEIINREVKSGGSFVVVIVQAPIR